MRYLVREAIDLVVGEFSFTSFYRDLISVATDGLLKCVEQIGWRR
jgi:hypothetical protein